MGTIGLTFIMFIACLDKAEVSSSGPIVSWGHKGKNNTPDTDTVLKDDVRYSLAMYLSIESMYLISWFMYGKDALAYYSPDRPRFEYQLQPIEEQTTIEDSLETFIAY